jgi:hypothetical protein
MMPGIIYSYDKNEVAVHGTGVSKPVFTRGKHVSEMYRHFIF